MTPQEEAQGLLAGMATFTGEDPTNCPIATECAAAALDMVLGAVSPARPDLYIAYYTEVRHIIKPPPPPPVEVERPGMAGPSAYEGIGT